MAAEGTAFVRSSVPGRGGGWGVCSASKPRVRSGKVESDLEWWAGKHPGPGLSGRSLVLQCIRRSVGWDASFAEKRGVRFR